MRSPPSRTERARVALVALVALAGSGCRPGAHDPGALDGATGPFTRLPYLQAVDTSTAYVLWRAGPDPADSVRYRVGDGDWLRAAVERAPVEAAGSGAASGAADPGTPSAVDRRIRLDGLAPGTRAQYEVFLDTMRFGPVGFGTAPRPGGSMVRVLAFGDSGFGSEAQLRLARLMEARSWDLAVHTGDIAYENGSPEDFTRRHFRIYRRLLSRVPFFPSPGNHDLRTDGGRPYDEAFVWPAPRPGARYYAFRWGDIRFLALDTSTPEAGRELRRRRGAQYEWLAAELEAAAADPTVRWTVTFFHHPLYSHTVGFSGHGSDLALRRALEPLFERHGVDLVLSGHDHHYERTHPLRSGAKVPDGCGPVYVVTGGGGASRFARSIAPAAVTARVSREHHFLDLSIGPTLLRGEAVGRNGDRIDSFLVRPFEGAGREPARCR